MSLRRNAPYADKIEDDGRILIYEGHDVPKASANQIPKLEDQQLKNRTGTLTQNGKFYRAAKMYKANRNIVELVKVYEKLRAGIWVYNGPFRLVEAWKEESNNRQVFKFKLEVDKVNLPSSSNDFRRLSLDHNRLIPPPVKLEVWKRDNGKCKICGSNNNLHFDHIIPFSKGGSSLVSQNIQLLCARHNLAKHDKIE